MQVSDYPIAEIRSQFPALQRTIDDRRIIFFDGPSGTQVTQKAIDEFTRYLKNGSSNLGGQYLTSIETEQIVASARLAMADMLGCSDLEIAFGMNMTSLTFDISRAMSRNWKPGDEIVVTEMDHRANVDPWIEAAQEKGATIKWIPLDTDRLTLDLSSLDTIITEKTVLVAIGHASNGIGTINDVKLVSERAHEVGALIVMDAVHSAPHLYIDMQELNVDIVLCSSYKFFGPHLGIVAIKEHIFEKLPVYRITTAPEQHPGKLETGTQSFEALAALVGTIDFIASLGEGRSRREQIKSAFAIIQSHENGLAIRIRNSLSTYPQITLYQANDDIEKTPTIAFRVDEYSPKEVCEYLATHGIFAGDGHFYARTIGDRLQLNRSGGWVRIGMAPYNTDMEVDQFLKAIDQLVAN